MGQNTNCLPQSGGRGPWLRKRTNRLIFCAAAARKNCSRTNLSLRRRKRRSPIWFLSSANKASTFFLLSLRLDKRWRID